MIRRGDPEDAGEPPQALTPSRGLERITRIIVIDGSTVTHAVRNGFRTDNRHEDSYRVRCLPKPPQPPDVCIVVPVLRQPRFPNVIIFRNRSHVPVVQTPAFQAWHAQPEQCGLGEYLPLASDPVQQELLEPVACIESVPGLVLRGAIAVMHDPVAKLLNRGSPNAHRGIAKRQVPLSAES